MQPRRPRDLNQLAAALVHESTDEDEELSDDLPHKDAARVELGRRGGLKGGRARASKLTPEERSAIARKAAAARWSSHRESEH